MKPESDIVKGVLEYLQLRNVYAWRMNTGAGFLQSKDSRTSRFIRFGFPGVSDIIGILNDGRFLAIECKSETGRLSADQRVFLAAVERRGGVAIVARGIEDVEKGLFAPKAKKEKEVGNGER